MCSTATTVTFGWGPKQGGSFVQGEFEWESNLKKVMFDTAGNIFRQMAVREGLTVYQEFIEQQNTNH